MTISKQELDEAIENCSRDPIHVPGAIQSFGYLLATDAALDVICYASENISDLFPQEAHALIGQKLADLFSDGERDQLLECLTHDTIETQREVALEKQIDGIDYQVSLHRQAGVAIIELIPQRHATNVRFRLLERARSVLAIPLEEHDLVRFFERACEHLRSINGFDRVKFYRFLPDGSGQVIAEARDSHVDSFLGLRFPEADIPPIARRLYAQTPIRTLSDVHGPDIPILADDAAEPLDMSLSVLRGKDQVHAQFLINMGIAATETVPIVVDGALWGLFSSHHLTQKDPDPSALSAVELIGKLISLRVQHALESRHQDDLRECLAIANRLMRASDAQLASEEYWSKINQDMSKLIDCDGMVFSINGHIDSFGRVPEEPAQKALLSMIDATGASVRAIDRLPEYLPNVAWGDTAGALVISPANQPRIRIIYFRDLTARKINWAGRPDKNITIDESGPKLNPRNSFETYIEHIKGRSDEWTATEINIATSFSEALGEIITVPSNLNKNQQRLGNMVGELHHRVRNILSLVQSLSRHSREESRSVAAYAQALESRVIALAGVPNKSEPNEFDGLLLSRIVQKELDAFEDQAGRIQIAGPDIALRPDAASVLTVLFHELTSNAAKFGALSDPSGQIHVHWQRDKDGLALFWRESDGPKVQTPSHHGFGRSIIEEAIPFEFNGDASLTFDKDGVQASFWLPGDVLAQEAKKLSVV